MLISWTASALNSISLEFYRIGIDKTALDWWNCLCFWQRLLLLNSYVSSILFRWLQILIYHAAQISYKLFKEKYFINHNTKKFDLVQPLNEFILY